MIHRYTEPEMMNLWSEKNKFYKWLRVGWAVLCARFTLGEFIFEPTPDMLEAIEIDADEINRIEREETKHDVTAFLNFISPQLPPELRSWFHRGLTSYDLGDTALSLLLLESLQLIESELREVMESLREKALQYKYTPQVGRTHGVHAEPITFGVKLLNWYQEFDRQLERLRQLRKRIAVGKISGAVGMYTIEPRIEKIACDALGLRPTIATQIISRDILAEYLAFLGNVASSLGKLALNCRLLSQTEIAEVREGFSKSQKGSSAMPHKKNPIGFENICSLMRLPGLYFQTALDNNANCWHERSLDNSGNERVIIADASTLVHYCLRRFNKTFKEMEIFTEEMDMNLEMTNGLIFSQEVMMLVASKGNMPREAAHTLVKDIAIKCFNNGLDFEEVLLKNNDIMTAITDPEELKKCFDIDKKLKYVDHIFGMALS